MALKLSASYKWGFHTIIEDEKCIPFEISQGKSLPPVLRFKYLLVCKRDLGRRAFEECIPQRENVRILATISFLILSTFLKTIILCTRDHPYNSAYQLLLDGCDYISQS